MKNLIGLLPDPTPDTLIRNSKSFYEAFQRLTDISELVYGSMEDAGMKGRVYDIFIMGGIPVHELVGHQFEEPVQIRPGDTATFKRGQYIENKNFIVKDDPSQEVEGLNVYGFVNFDAYGRRRNPVIHIENGEVKDFLGGEYTDEENLAIYTGVEKSRFVGASTQFENSDLPTPRMSCTVLDGKTEKISTEGKIVMIPYEGKTSPEQKTYLMKGEESYIIMDGKVKRIVPLQVTGTINNALKNMQLMEDFSYTPDTCGVGGLLTGKMSVVPTSQYTRNQLWGEQEVYPSLSIQENFLTRLIK
jgi:predicted Zn-dependent protease